MLSLLYFVAFILCKLENIKKKVPDIENARNPLTFSLQNAGIFIDLLFF